MEPEGRLPRSAWLVLAVAAAVFALAQAPHPPHPYGWTDASMLATAQSVAERGSLAIDESAYLWQGARVWVGGRWFSSEPPVLGLVCAAPYALARAALGVSIESAFVLRALVGLFVGLPVLLGLWSLGQLALAAGVRGRTCALAIAALAFTTPLLPYSSVLNPHAPAAGFAVAALLATTRGRMLSAGAAAGLAAALDPGAGMALVVFAWPVVSLGGVQGLARYALGALPPMALAAGLSVAVFGDPLPASAHPEAFAYPLSPAALRVEESAVERLVAAVAGPAGWATVQPIALIALMAGGVVAGRARRETRVAGAGLPRSIVTAAVVSAGVSGLWLALRPIAPEPPAFGDRRTCVAAALAMVAGAAWLGERCASARRVPRVAVLGIAAVVVWSTASAVCGAAGPWTRFEPWRSKGEGVEVGVVERWRREWLRVVTARREYSEVAYDRSYCERMTALADDVVEGRASSEGARDALSGVAAELDRLGAQVESRWAAWYELGRVLEQRGELEAALRAFERTAYLYPRHGPAREAVERLRRQGEVTE